MSVSYGMRTMIDLKVQWNVSTLFAYFSATNSPQTDCRGVENVFDVVKQSIALHMDDTHCTYWPISVLVQNYLLTFLFGRVHPRLSCSISPFVCLCRFAWKITYVKRLDTLQTPNTTKLNLICMKLLAMERNSKGNTNIKTIIQILLKNVIYLLAVPHFRTCHRESTHLSSASVCMCFSCYTKHLLYGQDRNNNNRKLLQSSQVKVPSMQWF